MESRDYVILAALILILLFAGYLLTKPQYYIAEKPSDQLERNDEVIIHNQPYVFQNKSEVPDEPEQIQLNFLDQDAEAVTLTVNKTDSIPVKVPVAWYDISPIPPPPLPTTLPAPVPPPPPPVQVPVPSVPSPNVTPPPVPTAPNVSVPTPPNATTPPPPLPPNVNPPLPPTPNATNITPIPPNASSPPPPPPVPVNITIPTPPPPTYPLTCTDGIWNGDESDLDCGGSCSQCLSTGMYNYCWDNFDCASGNCDTSGAQPLPPGYTIQSIRLLAGQAWIIPYQGICR